MTREREKKRSYVFGVFELPQHVPPPSAGAPRWRGARSRCSDPPPSSLDARKRRALPRNPPEVSSTQSFAPPVARPISRLRPLARRRDRPPSAAFRPRTRRPRGAACGSPTDASGAPACLCRAGDTTRAPPGFRERPRPRPRPRPTYAPRAAEPGAQNLERRSARRLFPRRRPGSKRSRSSATRAPSSAAARATARRTYIARASAGVARSRCAAACAATLSRTAAASARSADAARCARARPSDPARAGGDRRGVVFEAPLRACRGRHRRDRLAARRDARARAPARRPAPGRTPTRGPFFFESRLLRLFFPSRRRRRGGQGTDSFPSGTPWGSRRPSARDRAPRPRTVPSRRHRARARAFPPRCARAPRRMTTRAAERSASRSERPGASPRVPTGPRSWRTLPGDSAPSPRGTRGRRPRGRSGTRRPRRSRRRRCRNRPSTSPSGLARTPEPDSPPGRVSALDASGAKAPRTRVGGDIRPTDVVHDRLLDLGARGGRDGHRTRLCNAARL